MSKYLLLRNNKQSGPFSLDEIRTMGLKAYDLIWVEGKSAAWRYPGEIEELKSFAPMVEEQPFDRFFKKPVSEEHPALTPKQPAANSDNQRFAPLTSDHETANHDRLIFVDVPTEQQETFREKENREYAEKKQTAREKPVQKTYSKISPVSMSAGQDDNFTSPADEARKTWPPKQAASRKNNNGEPRKVIQPVLVGFMMGILLAGGIFIGLSINYRGSNSTQKDLTHDQSAVQEQQTYPIRTIPVSSSVADQAKKTDSTAANNQLAENNNLSDQQQDITVEKKKSKPLLKPKTADSARVQKPAVVKTDSSSSLTTQRQATHRTDAIPQKDDIRSNIEDYVTVGSNKYNVGTFGGISDLQLTVSNTSPYPLDMVVVEVQYIQSNKKTFKTESVYFRNVGAHSALMQEAPKSSRGVKIKYRITIINSKESGIDFSDI